VASPEKGRAAARIILEGLRNRMMDLEEAGRPGSTSPFSVPTGRI
jgi:hypothetical protein